MRQTGGNLWEKKKDTYEAYHFCIYITVSFPLVKTRWPHFPYSHFSVPVGIIIQDVNGST